MGAPYYDRHGVTVHAGDCLDVLRTMADASVDAVVCDPPYGLADHKPAALVTALTAWVNGDREHVPDGRGFMGRDWDRFVPPPAVWDECLRVLKPGGHLLCFAGSRTVDLMGLSVRLAGFEIRDSITWIYGTGFPKSLDVSKAIDRTAGAQREIVGSKLNRPGYHLHGHDGGEAFGPGLSNSTPETRLRSSEVTAPATPAAERWQGWGTALKPAHEPIVLARKPLGGTVAANVLTHGTGALNIDTCRVKSNGESWAGDADRSNAKNGFGPEDADGWQGGWTKRSESHSAGRWPANVILEESAATELDQQSGLLTSGKVGPEGFTGPHTAQVYGKYARNELRPETVYGDTGGASRFFPVFRWEAKAPTEERPQVAGVAHPTVKPLALMRWLVRLVTPPGGLVLDPFAGSGTTLHAARAEGFRAVGIEREPTYLPLIKARLDARPRQAAPTTSVVVEDEPLDLLDFLGDAS